MEFPKPSFHAIIIVLQDMEGKPIVVQHPSMVGTDGLPSKVAISSTCATIRDTDGLSEIIANLTSVAKAHLSAAAISFKDPIAGSMLTCMTMRGMKVAWGGGLRALDAAVTEANYGSVFKAIIQRKCVDVVIVQMEPALTGCTPS